MARLKKDHSGYHSSGLHMKYQQSSVSEKLVKSKNKKDTRRWCRGKVGTEHTPRRYFLHYGWDAKRTNLIRMMCIECRKSFHKVQLSAPLTIDIDEIDGKSYPIQVKVNGVALPIDYRLYINGRFCNLCQIWEYDD